MRSARRVLLAVLLFLVFGLFLLWALLTQPTLPQTRRTGDFPSGDPRRLETHVRKLVGEFSPRDVDHPENLDRAASYIRAQFEQAGVRSTEQEFALRGRTYRNVIARLGAETRERIVVGAHYDAYGGFPGADDNASGLAGLLELVRLLGDAPLARRVEAVAFTLEEPPSFGGPEMGSAVHARSLRDAGVAVRAMISLEMIGYFSDERKSQTFPIPLLRLFYPGRGHFIAVVGRTSETKLVRIVKSSMRSASKLPVYSINAPRAVTGVDLSDHASYWNLGYPAVMITDTAFFRNERYHTPDDRPDTLDYNRMAEVVRGVSQAVRDLANR